MKRQFENNSKDPFNFEIKTSHDNLISRNYSMNFPEILHISRKYDSSQTIKMFQTN